MNAYLDGLDHKETEAKKQLEMLTQTKTYECTHENIYIDNGHLALFKGCQMLRVATRRDNKKESLNPKHVENQLLCYT